jgi:hypothetical protein
MPISGSNCKKPEPACLPAVSPVPQNIEAAFIATMPPADSSNTPLWKTKTSCPRKAGRNIASYEIVACGCSSMKTNASDPSSMSCPPRDISASEGLEIFQPKFLFVTYSYHLKILIIRPESGIMMNHSVPAISGRQRFLLFHYLHFWLSWQGAADNNSLLLAYPRRPADGFSSWTTVF